jgi:hypothetical protein
MNGLRGVIWRKRPAFLKAKSIPMGLKYAIP